MRLKTLEKIVVFGFPHLHLGQKDSMWSDTSYALTLHFILFLRLMMEQIFPYDLCKNVKTWELSIWGKGEYYKTWPTTFSSLLTIGRSRPGRVTCWPFVPPAHCSPERLTCPTELLTTCTLHTCLSLRPNTESKDRAAMTKILAFDYSREWQDSRDT